MFILNKKRIYIVLGCLLMSTIIFQARNLTDMNKQVVETVALPVNNKVIVLDAGHGRRRSTELTQKMEPQKQI